MTTLHYSTARLYDFGGNILCALGPVHTGKVISALTRKHFRQVYKAEQHQGGNWGIKEIVSVLIKTCVQFKHLP